MSNDLKDWRKFTIGDKDGDGIRDEYENVEVSDKHKQQYKDRIKGDHMKDLKNTAFGRTLRGKNRTGRFIHSVIDVLPIPNVHEVIKAVIKDAETEDKVIGITDLASQTFKRLDWFRTGAGIGVVALYFFDVLTLQKAQDVFEFILQFI